MRDEGGVQKFRWGAKIGRRSAGILTQERLLLGRSKALWNTGADATTTFPENLGGVLWGITIDGTRSSLAPIGGVVAGYTEVGVRAGALGKGICLRLDVGQAARKTASFDIGQRSTYWWGIVAVQKLAGSTKIGSLGTSILTQKRSLVGCGETLRNAGPNAVTAGIEDQGRIRRRVPVQVASSGVTAVSGVVARGTEFGARAGAAG